MMRCDQCKHFYDLRGDYYLEPFGLCGAIVFNPEAAGGIAVITANSCDGPEYADADLLTRADFGCVLFERKPKPPKAPKAPKPAWPRISDKHLTIFEKVQAGSTFKQVADELGLSTTAIHHGWRRVAISEMQRTGELVSYHSPNSSGVWPPRTGWYIPGSGVHIPPKIQKIIDEQEAAR